MTGSAKPANKVARLLEVCDLSVEFRTRNGVVQGLDRIGFTVERAETLGIVGESGSGKSITTHSLLGILDRAGRITGGRALFEGFDLLSAPPRALAEIRGREIATIFQNPRVALNPIRKVGYQIEDVLREHTTTLSRDLRARAVELLKLVRIVRPEDRYHAYPFQLSGGMCQRVMIAIALACEPRLLIADEPTTGLDATTQKIIMDLIHDLARERQMSTILITHDLGLAAAYCQKIVVMQRGKVVEAAETASLFRNARHPYTQKLIKATPRLDSTLADIDVEPEETAGVEPAFIPATPQANGSAASEAVSNAPLLEVSNLRKLYRLKGDGALARWSRLAKRRFAGAVVDDQDEWLAACDGISFTLMAGESLGVVGESGSGKSTLSSMIARLLDPTEGQIMFDGQDLTEIRAAAFSQRPERRLIQMVFQDPTESLNPRFTARDSIADPLKRLDGLRPGKALDARVGKLAAMVGLPAPLLDRFPHQLSGGQKARVGIARAISVSPKLLILDEPTSALDVSIQAMVLNLLDRLRHDLGIAYIFVSHDLNVVRLLCDRILVMNHGQAIELGNSRQILETPESDYTRSLIAAIPHFSP